MSNRYLGYMNSASSTVLLFGILISSIALCGTALAEQPTIDNWSGSYLGILSGFGFGQKTLARTGNHDSATNTFLNHTGMNGQPGLVGSFDNDLKQAGIFAGALAGYNWQIDRKVLFGLETDLQFANVRGSSSSIVYEQPSVFGHSFPFIATGERELNWLSTVRARVGIFATSDTLIYGTVGLGLGQATSRGSISNPNNFISSGGVGVGFACDAAAGPATCFSGHKSSTQLGWVAGMGIERKVSNAWSIRLDYLHTELSGSTIRMNSPSPPSTPGVFLEYIFSRQRYDVGRISVVYNFDSVPK